MNLKKRNQKKTSPDFVENGQIPVKFTCDGEGISPALVISEVPPQTASLALILDDPDAPSNNFTHWIVWNIPPDTSEIQSAKIPSGSIEGVNGSGKNGYLGPCPPSGTHRYIFHLFALNQMLNLEQKSSRDDLEAEMEGKIMEEAELIGLYQQK